MGRIVRGLQDEGRTHVVARSRVGDVRHRDAGGWTRRERASMVRRWRDRSYGGRAWRCWPVHTDARIRHALRRSAGGRLSPAWAAGLGCRTGILRPGSRDHLQAAISTAWSRPIDPPAAARLSLGQAGEFTKCLLSGDLYCCTVTADGHRYPVTSPSRPACCRPCESQRWAILAGTARCVCPVRQ